MALSRQLSMQGPSRLFEEFRLKGSDAARVREIGVVGTAYDSILAKDLVYVSTPITSGAILYKALKQAGVKTLDELRQDKKFFFENVIKPNIENADVVAHRLLDMKGGAIIAPASFEAKQLGWGQDDYMGMWLDVIEKKATGMAMIDGWEYSNGGAEEYLQALLMQAGRRDRNNIALMDERGVAITQTNAVRLLGRATEDLLNQNFQPVTTIRVLNRIIQLWTMVSSEADYGQKSDAASVSHDYNGDYFTSYESNELFREAVALIRPALTEGLKLLPAEERDNKSSALMLPTVDQLVRKEERSDLAQTGVQVLSDEETPAPKKDGPKPELS